MLDLLLIVLEDLDPGTPPSTEVKAGPLGFLVWAFMILAVVVLGFSLVKQLRKAEANKRAGAFGDEPETDEPETDEPETDEPGTDVSEDHEPPTHQQP